MNDNVQDLVDRLRKPGYMDASLIAADLIEKLAALPEKEEWSKKSYQRGYVHGWNAMKDHVDQIFTEVLGNDNTR